jgi:hypothetical protein
VIVDTIDERGASSGIVFFAAGFLNIFAGVFVEEMFDDAAQPE